MGHFGGHEQRSRIIQDVRLTNNRVCKVVMGVLTCAFYNLLISVSTCELLICGGVAGFLLISIKSLN